MHGKTLLLVDDHPVFRKGMSQLLAASELEFGTIVEAENRDQALLLSDVRSIDYAILDVELPGIDGLALMRELKEKVPEVVCVMMSMYDKRELVKRAFDLGADGYLVKTDAEATIVECLKTVADRKPYLSASIGKLSSVIAEENAFYAEGLDQLTSRELEILKQIAQSRTSKEIARDLDLSYRTVQNHRSNICTKLHLSGANALMKVIMTFPHLFNDI